MRRYILALDQGTTSSRAVLFDREARIAGFGHRDLPQIYPRPGWVEHEPDDIWNTQLGAILDAIEAAGADPDDIEALGITNQRETTIVWERASGKPIHRAIVWQCRRTAELCERLKLVEGFEERVRSSTGLVVDAYFSATKIKWILDNVPGALARARAGELLFGTVDSWLLWRLSAGAIHATDATNASRTMLFDTRSLSWDERLLADLDIPRSMLPEVRPSSYVYGATDPRLFGGREIPIAGVAGDQHAALFGQACFAPGAAKNTYGTGCFLMMNTGSSRVPSARGLLTTVAWQLPGRTEYALEGSVFVAGAAVQWLRDELGLVREARETESVAASVSDSLGVYLVPAFVGLGAPYWDMYARGTIVGLTRGAGRSHLVRATLESIAYQTRDVLRAIEDDSGIPVRELKVDGGASVNAFLMQFQADILGVSVVRPRVIETSALGAAYLAGLSVGFWKSTGEIEGAWAGERVFSPRMGVEERTRLYGGWLRAVERARDWAR